MGRKESNQTKLSLQETICTLLAKFIACYFLYLQEFECGVHFGGGENSKQEWSFTLYDFDGHGKITKEVCPCLFDLMYYIPVNNSSVMFRHNKLNTAPPLRLEPQVVHSTTESLHSFTKEV